MKEAKAYIFKARGGHWMAEVFVDGQPVLGVGGCASEEEAIEVAEGEYAYYFRDMDYSIVRGRPDAPR